MSMDKTETLKICRAQVAPLPKVLKYTGFCLAAAASAAFIRARLRASFAARATRADTVRLEPQCLTCLPTQVSVFSMNVLSQSLVTQQRYKYCPSKYLAWEYRLQKLIHLIETACADVVCLQEVEVARQEELVAIMKTLGYTAVVQDRSKTKFTICNATFFRSNKLCHTWTESRSRALITGFKLIPDMEFVAELATTTVDSGKGPSASSSPAVGRTDVPHSSASGADGEPVLANEEGAAGAAEVFVANCHLEGHPWKAQERFNQIKGVLTKMERRQSEAGAPMDDARILIVGDFNSARSEALHRYLFRGRLEGGYWEPFQRRQPVVETTEAHPFSLRDVYNELAKFPMGYTYGRPSGSCTIDYIWASSALHVSSVLKCLSRCQEVEWQQRGIPNEHHPSDHLPLGVVVDVALSSASAGVVEAEMEPGAVCSNLGRVELVDGIS